MFARESTPVTRKNKTAGLSRIHSDEKRKRERELLRGNETKRKKKVFLFEMRINVCLVYFFFF